VELTVQELAALVGGQFAAGADGSRRVCGVAAVSEAVEGDVTFFGNSKYLPQLKRSAATAALVPLDFEGEIPPVPIRVANPSLAFAELLQRFAPPPIQFAPGVHPTAVVGRNVELGKDVSVQPHAVIEDGVKIGANTIVGAQSYVGHEAQIGSDCLLSPRVTLGARSVVGNRVILHSGVVIGSDGFGFEFSEGRHVKVPQTGFVQLDDDVEVGANTTIDRARFGRTWIGEGTKIDNLVQIAHNVVIGKHSIIVSQTGIAGSAKLGNYVTMGGQAAVVGHVEIGDQVTVAARGGISKSVAPNQTMFGYVAMPMQEAKEQFVLQRRLPKFVERLKKLEQLVNSASKLPSGNQTLESDAPPG
jgi:UDP-3-O-[3-hydroxymyristoyl] glucosamine N-acyltransferase